MLGRLPDFCAAMIVGFHDTRAELNALHAGFGDNATRYLKYARQNDLALSHGLHDPHMDKTLRPRQDPDRCLRIVARARQRRRRARRPLRHARAAQQRGRGGADLRAGRRRRGVRDLVRMSGEPARHPPDLPRPVHPAAADRRSSAVDPVRRAGRADDFRRRADPVGARFPDASSRRKRTRYSVRG